jgi:hypothetical protein
MIDSTMTDQTLTDDEIADFRCIAGFIVPPSTKYDVPGADDAAIFADIVASVGHDFALVRVALATLRGLANGPFCALDPGRRAEVAAQLRAAGGTAVRVLTRLVLLCYYRDDRVLVSLGLEARPPFPTGHVIEQGDWSLLDVVRARRPIWRPAT